MLSKEEQTWAKGILTEVASVLPPDQANALRTSWQELDQKTRVLTGLIELRDHGVSRRKIVDELTDGGYAKRTNVAATLYQRLHKELIPRYKNQVAVSAAHLPLVAAVAERLTTQITV